jgi:hypothetical protein
MLRTGIVFNRQINFAENFRTGELFNFYVFNYRWRFFYRLFSNYFLFYFFNRLFN